eukprot:1157542-Pelagomonas_calceolata.AAC.3
MDFHRDLRLGSQYLPRYVGFICLGIAIRCRVTAVPGHRCTGCVNLEVQSLNPRLDWGSHGNPRWESMGDSFLNARGRTASGKPVVDVFDEDR